MITSAFFSNGSIQVVIGSSSTGKISVSQYYEAPLPEGAMLNGVITNDFAIKGQLGFLWEKYKLPKNNIHIIIDSSSILTKTITVPMTSDDNIVKIVRGEFVEIENYNELIYDYFVINPRLETGGASVLGCATEKGFISNYVELFDAVKGAKIESIDLAVNSVIKLVRFIPAIRAKTFIVGVVDKNAMMLLLFVNGMFKFSSRTRLFTDINTAGFSDEVGRAVSSMMQFASSQKYNAEISDVFFCGLGERGIKVCQDISSVLTVQNVQVFPGYNDIVKNKIKRPEYQLSLSNSLYCIGNLIRM